MTEATLEQRVTPSDGSIGMNCYPCTKQGHSQPAVALCRSCFAGLCLEHLRETADHFATDEHRAIGIMADTCHHDTWATDKTASAGPHEQ